MKTKDFKKYINDIKELCDIYLDYIEQIGNECAYTDRMIEKILNNSKLLQKEYDKKFEIGDED